MTTPHPVPAMAWLFALLCFSSCYKNIQNPVLKKIRQLNEVNTSVVVTKEYFVSPKVTDPAITTALSDHFVSIREGGVNKNILYLFFPGTHRNPSVCRATIKKAASLGYHSIGLMYDNLVAGNPLCSATGDITCHRRARLEVVDGVDRHPGVNVNTENSLINRLTKLLLYLDQTYPEQSWGQYLIKGEVDWTNIIVAGHSQGGAIAGVIGKHYPVKKVIMFSMIDYLNDGKIPDWEVMPSNTAKFYHLINPLDELIPYAKVRVVWDAMGMSKYGGRVNVDFNLAPYGNTHTLITSRTPATSLIDKYHNGTGVDKYIPKNSSGVYVYDKAWEYLITK